MGIVGGCLRSGSTGDTRLTRRPRGLHRLAERAGMAVAVLLLLGAVAIAVASVAAARGGYQIVAMQTSSMSPIIDPGDLVVVHRIAPEAIRVGDIITFQEPIGSHLIVTHRVVEKEPSPAGPVFRTKGDNNQANDPWQTRYTGTGWKVARVLPEFGSVLAAMSGPLGRVLAGVVIFVVSAILLDPVIRRPRDEGEA